jgi:FkbM family methyltransferase
VNELGLATLQWYVRHFPISKGKGRLVSWLWKPLSSGNRRRQTVLRRADVQFVCDLTKLIQRHIYFWGGYEEESCVHWLRLARESRIIFDIGANVGLYSLLASWANPQSQVYAFEPTLEVATILQANIDLNSMENISVERVAVGDSERTGFLHFCAGSDGSNEGMNYVSRDRKDESDLPVDVVSLDSYCQSQGIECIDLMKMDIEGGEYEALLGARQLLQKQAIGCVFLEMAEWAAKRSGHSTYEIKRLLVDAGYRLFKLGSQGIAPMAMEATTRSENVFAFAGESGHWSARKAPGAAEAEPWQLP